MRVVPVNAPRLKHAINVAVVSGTAYVIDDFIATVLDQRVANLRRERFEHLVPGGSFPLTFAARADSLKREENSFGIVDLIYRRRALGTVAPARTWVQRIALELLNLAGVLIDVGEQPASGFAVEARGRHKRVTALDFFRPAPGVVFDPVIPPVERRVA